MTLKKHSLEATYFRLLMANETDRVHVRYQVRGARDPVHQLPTTILIAVHDGMHSDLRNGTTDFPPKNSTRVFVLPRT